MEQILLLAFLVESLTNGIKLIYDPTKRKINVDIIIALVVSIALFILAKVDLFALVGVPLSVPYAGYVLSGILGARGAQALSDIFKYIKVQRQITPSQ